MGEQDCTGNYRSTEYGEIMKRYLFETIQEVALVTTLLSLSALAAAAAWYIFNLSGTEQQLTAIEERLSAIEENAPHFYGTIEHMDDEEEEEK